jgi:hypothetical protein
VLATESTDPTSRRVTVFRARLLARGDTPGSRGMKSKVQPTVGPATLMGLGSWDATQGSMKGHLRPASVDEKTARVCLVWEMLIRAMAAFMRVKCSAWQGSPGAQAKISGQQLVSSKSTPCFRDVALRVFVEDPTVRRCVLELAVRSLRLSSGSAPP